MEFFFWLAKEIKKGHFILNLTYTSSLQITTCVRDNVQGYASESIVISALRLRPIVVRSLVNMK